jgi:hypothetical protein
VTVVVGEGRADMSTDMVIHSNGAALAPIADQRMALEPRSFEDGMRLAEIVVKSGMFGVKNEADAFVRISTGVGLGLSAVQSLRGIYVIHGRAGISADLMMALSVSHPDCEYFRPVETTTTKATFETKRRSHPTPVSLSFTIDDAKTAELTKSEMYRKFPAQMLRARCIAGLARLVYPERMHGLYTPDEIKVGTVSPDEIPEAEFSAPIAVDKPIPTVEIAHAAREVSEAAAESAAEQALVDEDLRQKYASATTPEGVAAIDKIVAYVKPQGERRARLLATRAEAAKRVAGASA